MNKTIRYLCSFYMLFFSVFVSASYTMTELEGTPWEVPDTVNTVVWDNLDTNFPNDDDKQTIVLDFPFQFDSVSYPALTIFTNGIIKFLPTDRMHRVYTNEQLPTNKGDEFIAVYWDDLVDDESSSVTYGTSGVAPNRRFIVSWNNVESYFGNLRYDFQVVLYENGDIRYRYNNNTSNGESATIGLEINDTDFIQYSYDSVSVEVSFDLFFRNELLALPEPIAQYRFDETSWDGSAGEVVDSGINGLNGRSFSNANTENTASALGSNIGTCHYGTFDGVSDFVEIPDNPIFDLPNNFSVGVWIKIDSLPSSGLKTIVSKDDNFEFHVNSSGQISWWWRTATLNQVRQLNSTISIVPGQWTHVVISFATLTQTIFINGIEAGSDVYPEEAITNTKPLQIAADQGFVGRNFNGDIDEVNIFGQALIEAQARELMEKTRPCPSFNLCVSSFPDGLNSHTSGDIDFGENAQLFFSPTDSLYAGNVSLTGSSFKRSCVSVECQANGLAVEATVPASFPNTVSNTNNVTINNNNSGSIGGSENDYKDISAGNNATINVVSGYSNYYIDDLSIGDNGTLNLAAGTYWVNNFTAGSGLNITVAGGTARLYINNTFTLPRDAIINSPSANSQGDASQFLLYGYNSINAGRNLTFSGVIYAMQNIVLDRDSNYYGAITGSNITINSNTKVFFNPSATANLNYGDLCESASCSLGGFSISQPSYALACPGTRSEISIQAMCDDGTSPKEDYAGTVNLTTNEDALSEFYATLTSATTINSLVFDGTELGAKDVYLFHQNENSGLYVTVADTVEGVSSTSINPTDFRTTGFAITEPSSFTCGGNSSLRLTAIGEDDTGLACQTLTGFTGVKDLKAWYQVNIDSNSAADTVTTNLQLDNQSIGNQSEPTTNNISLTFNNGIADVDIGYANAGNILGVNFKHDDAPYDGSVPEFSALTASSTSFVVKPNQINLSIADANAACATGMANESCSKFVAAAAPFAVNSEAQCIGGGIADDYQGNIAITHGLVAPASGNIGSLAINSATFGSADGGAIQINNQSISEVGVFSITATPSTYYGETITPFTLPTVGRFYPASFSLTSSALSNSCAPASGDFSYMSQPGINISYELEARNAAGIKTLNYDGAFAKATLSLVAENNNQGTNYGSRLNGFGSTNWGNGDYVFSNTGSFNRLASGTPDGLYQDLKIGIQLADNDGNVSPLNGLNMRADANTDCATVGNCNALALTGNLDVRFGQLKLNNVFGPETSDLDMTVQTEYFDGTRFVVNTDDSCTVLTLANVGADNEILPASPPLTANIVSGEGTIRFDAAGLGNQGSSKYQQDTINYIPWLNTENNDDGDYADNPFGTVTFGQFRGNDRRLYWREIVY